MIVNCPHHVDLTRYEIDHRIGGLIGSFPIAMATATLALLSLAAVKTVVISQSLPIAAAPSAQGDSFMGKIFGTAVLDTVHAVGCSCLAASVGLLFI
jgi:hypothetical protein